MGLIPAHAGKTACASERRRASRAHPRSRGENNLYSASLIAASGSSPLTRGKPVGSRSGRRPCGLIPAHAGKTRWGRGRGWLPRAHPRSRGENDRQIVGFLIVAGSSPLTRGKPNYVDGFNVGPGLIPAHAGKTADALHSALISWAHPRSRGENAVLGMMSMHENGSSPLTRGKRLAVVVQEQRRGLIPAHAGKTGGSPGERSGAGAHPRSRGENPGNFASKK